MSRRRALSVGLLLALLLPVLSLHGGPAQAQGALAQGWWSALHRSAVPVDPPPPPDVGPDDLLLQGGDPGRLAPAGAVDGRPAPTAVAALRFQVDPAAQVGPLLLPVSAGAQAADVRAYPAAAGWRPAQGGAIEDAPAADLSRYSTGRLSTDGTALVFDDIGRLVTEQGLLSLVLVAGPADRVVVHHPTAAALTVVPPAPTDDPDHDALPPVDPAGPAVPAGTAALPALPVAAAAVPPAGAGPALAPAPVLVAPAAPAAAPASVVRRVLPDDRRTRVVVALEALLVAVWFGLLGVGPLAVLARRGGGLLGAPGAADGAAAPVAVARGIGRFRSERVGTAPRL